MWAPFTDGIIGVRRLDQEATNTRTARVAAELVVVAWHVKLALHETTLTPSAASLTWNAQQCQHQKKRVAANEDARGARG